MPIGSNSTSTSPTRFNDNNSNSSVNGASDRKNSLDSNSSNGSGGGGKLVTMSYDPTSYIQRARVTRPAPPKPSCNPMQFVQIKPCNLYQTAQEQLKKAEEVKKVKEIKKEEPEDWQSNLDNWKSSRRKRVEHIIDRVVEVKKLELEEHDRTRRKSKTFSEMLEERSSRRTKLASLSVYTEDESNDLSDLGIGTSSTSGKSSLSEDYDNHSVMSDNVDTEKSTSDLLINHHDNHNHNHHLNHENGISSNRDYISSPGYETSSSTAPTSSPDPCEYTYEGAIQDYKTRISRAQSNNNGFNRSTVSSPYSKDSTPERNTIETNYTSSTRRLSGNKIENRLTNFEVKSSTTTSSTLNTSINDLSVPKKDLPKVDILKRRELFEKENSNSASTESISGVGNQKRLSGDFTTTKSIRERLSNLEKRPMSEQENKQKMNRLSGDITSLKDRLQNLERQTSVTEKIQKIDVPVVPLKDRLSSLQNAVQKEEIKKPVLLVDEHQLEILKKEELEKQHILRKEMLDDDNLSSSQEILNLQDESNVDTDREDSGIHTTDVSCSVSQTDEQPDLVNEESHHHINAEDGLCQNVDRQLQSTSEILHKCEENLSSTSCVPDVIRNSTNEPVSPNKLNEDQQQQQQQQQQSPDDQNANTISPEPLVDQEASVSLSLSESPTISSSQQTIIFNGKTASETGAGSLENITSISQLSVEGALGVDYNCSNKHSVVGNGSTNTSFTYGKNSKFDTDKTGKEVKKTVYGTQFKFDFTNNGSNNSKTKPNEKSFENSKFILKTDSVIEDKINIEKWIEQNLEQNKSLDDDTSPLSLPSDIDIELSKSSQVSPTRTNNIHAHENNTNTKKQNFESKAYGEIIFDSKLLSPKTSKKLIEDSPNDKSIVQSQKEPEIENKTSSITQSSSKFEKNKSSENLKIEPQPNQNTELDEVETICLKIRPPSFKSKLKLPAKGLSSRTNSEEKRQTIIETCEKVNVHDLPDPAHIPTPFIDVSLENLKASDLNETSATIKIPRPQSSPTKIPTLTKSLPPTSSTSPSSSTLLLPVNSSKCKSAPNSPLKESYFEKLSDNKFSGKQNSEIPISKSSPNSTASTPDGSRNSVIVAKFEVVETKIKVTSNDSNHQQKTPVLPLPKIPKSPKSSKSPILSPKSPKINTKTHPDLKPKNIFDFLRKNFSPNHDNDDSNNVLGGDDSDDIGAVSVDNSKFYIALSTDHEDDINVNNENYYGNGSNDVNIEITKTIKTDRIVEKADSIDSDTTMTNEINQLLDEELSKLATTTEDTRL